VHKFVYIGWSDDRLLPVIKFVEEITGKDFDKTPQMELVRLRHSNAHLLSHLSPAVTSQLVSCCLGSVAGQLSAHQLRSPNQFSKSDQS